MCVGGHLIFLCICYSPPVTFPVLPDAFSSYDEVT